ncbi:MAG: DUF5005 domain-containing protein [Leptolyngbya sp. PLA2]|nr:DUF5005 domain-containing protein [Leptolyngbya sp.]MCE7970878.1 DUF5005 domain-containing protein [Leptolyngbya sp. PL-A2]MCQ3940307.1 hypothetical protein [cyanobacterium CYA1]MDL1904623.1 DUF5005 domain-containing protein [Synechococcales cyanobacterium CNB]
MIEPMGEGGARYGRGIQRRRGLRPGAFAFVLALGCFALSCGTAVAQPAAGAEGQGPVRAPEWDALFVRTIGWTGADGAASVVLSPGRVLWLFGDTWIGPVRDNRHTEGSVMVNNTIAVHQAEQMSEAPERAEFFWDESGIRPASWATPEQPSEWFWPAGGGLVVRDGGEPRLLVFMTRLSRRDEPDSVWNFTCRGSTLLTIKNPDDDPSKWRVVQSTLTSIAAEAPLERTWGTAVVPDPEDAASLLVFGIDGTEPLNKRALLARAPVSSVDRFETWSFRTADGWSGVPGEAVSVSGNVASEVSIHEISDRFSGKHFVMIYSEPPLGAGIMARTALRPEGPWSEPVRLYECPEPGLDPRNLVYSAKAHPHLSREGELLVSYCVNSTDFRHMAANADLYLPRFVRVPLAHLPVPFGE